MIHPIFHNKSLKIPDRDGIHQYRPEKVQKSWLLICYSYHVPDQRAGHLISDKKYKNYSKMKWYVFLPMLDIMLDIKIRDVHSTSLSKISDNTEKIQTKFCL